VSKTTMSFALPDELRHPDFVVDVRGKGLMIGVEFATDEACQLTVGQMLKCGMCAAYTLNNPRSSDWSRR
jgi:acetylornithine/succinyldiaminopimelate/putrescine aminotransferase